MKKIAFMLISFYMGLMGANAQSNKYDLNEDGHVNITDVTKLVTNILDQNNINGYDLNNDGDVNITDVILLVNYILGKDNGFGDTSQAYLVCPDDNHPHMLDLGLPSGTLWACCNVGASSPEEYGGYYSWGEVNEKAVYNDVTYQHSIGVDYDGDGNYDWADNHYLREYINLGSDISGTEYDVAHVKWRGKWQMPNKNQVGELLGACHEYWIENNTIKFRGPSGGIISFPFTGFRAGDALIDNETYGDYWISNPEGDGTNETTGYAYMFYVDPLGNSLITNYGYHPSYILGNKAYKNNGRTVRAVWKE